MPSHSQSFQGNGPDTTRVGKYFAWHISACRLYIWRDNGWCREKGRQQYLAESMIPNCYGVADESNLSRSQR